MCIRRISCCAICLILGSLALITLLAIALFYFRIPAGVENVTLPFLAAFVYHKLFAPLISYFAEIFKSLFPWPFFGLVVLVLLLLGPDRATMILSAIERLELPGVKLKARAAPDRLKKGLSDASRVVDSANRELHEAYTRAREYAAQIRSRHDIPEQVKGIATGIAELLGDKCPDDYRLTLYIPDLIFTDRLYQLTEYYNKKGAEISKGRAGRSFSIRYGIIGRVWRSGVSEIEGQLIPKDELQQLGVNPDRRKVEQFIAKHWGVTLEEAARIRRYNSYGAIRVELGQKALGLIYFDSKGKDAFGDIEGQIQQLIEESLLPEKLSEVSREVAPWSGRIQIYRNS